MKELINKIITTISLTLLVSGCSGKKDNTDIELGNKDFADAFVSQIKPSWFTALRRFSIVDRNKRPVIHRFFDVKPFRNIKLKTINTVIVTPEGSEYLNQIDLASGQLYSDKKFCAQSDEYKKFTGSINKPNFSIGVMPRVLDQLNLAQKVIVFGGSDYFQKYHQTHYFDVRIVGGFIEQVCPYGGCLRLDQWLSRLVLVGVQSGDTKMAKIKTMKDIQENFDWNYSRAFIENGEGKNMLSDKFYPRKKMGALIGADQALRYIDKNSTIFTVDKLKSMRLSCFKLYDYMWKDLSYVNTGALNVEGAKAIREKALKLQKNKKKGVRDISFARRFAKNIKKFGEQYKTCSRYIYSTNINEDPDRHWFFAHIDAFYKLHDLGYAFNCDSKVWDVNPIIHSGKRVRSLQAQFASCEDQDLDRAFEFAPSILDNLRSKRRKSYRYIDYDKGLTGTHLKIFNWVQERPAVMSCSDEKERDYNLSKEIFPDDIKWKKRDQGRGKKSRNGIIY